MVAARIRAIRVHAHFKVHKTEEVMMRQQRIDVRAYTAAPPDRVYALLTDGATWPIWSKIRHFELEKAGETEPESVGAIRIFRIPPVTTREQIVELVAQRRLGYVVLSGLPLREYRANIDLTVTDSGTEIRWHSTFLPKIPGTGWFYRRFLSRFIQQCADGLAAYAARAATPDRQ